MAIRDRSAEGDTESARLRRKANQHWEMAGLARQDGDKADADRHTRLARELDAQAAEAKHGETL